jgi:hypothetical protein
VAAVGPASAAGPDSAAGSELVDPAALLITCRRFPKASGACFGVGSPADPDAPGAVVRGLFAGAAELLLTGAAGLLGPGAAGAPVTGAAGLLLAGAARLPVAGFGCGALSRASGAGHGSLARAAPSLWLNRSMARSSAASALAASPRALASRRPCWWAETSTTRVPGSACTRRACSCIGLPGEQ